MSSEAETDHFLKLPDYNMEYDQQYAFATHFPT
jgi:hypothetical protein